MEEDKKTEQIKQMMEERGEKDESKPLALKDELAEAKKYYTEKGSTVKIKSVLSKDGFFYADDDETYKLKHDFIVEVVGAANEKKDAEFQSYLKDFAKQFDEKLNGSTNDSLFLSLVTAYPELLSKSDLKWMVDSVKGKKDKFANLCNFILCYIDPEKEPNACDKNSITDEEVLKRFNFIWEVFKAIKSYGESWAKIGETYLDGLFSDDYVSFGIFTPRFFKKRRAKNFIYEVSKYCNKYLKGSRFDLGSTEIYDHYRQTKKSEKKRNIFVAAASVAVVVGIGAGLVTFLKSVNKNTIEFHGDSSVVISYVYGTSPDLGGWYITYKHYDGSEHKVSVDEKMLSDIDTSKIGVQQRVTITYRGKTYTGLQIRIDPATLLTPVISRTGTDVTWEAIPNATGYEIYITDNEITSPQGAPTATVEEGKTSFNVAEVCKPGRYNVYVRAIYKGKDDTTAESFKNSALSGGVKIEKLGAVSGVEYSGGTLKWNAVDKANKYDIAVNGVTVAEGITSPSYAYKLGGGEKITVEAKSNDETVYSSSAEFTVLNSPEVSYDGEFVSWTGGALYNVSIADSSGTEKVKITEKTDIKTDISAFAKGVYTVTVQAVGSGSSVSSPEYVIKFAVGYAVTVDKTGGTQKIKWDGASLGRNFKVIVNGTESGATIANEYPISDGFTQAGTYTVAVVATDENVYFASVTITKLAAPELVLDKDRMSWSAIPVKAGQAAVYSVNGEIVSELPTAFDTGLYTVTAHVKSENATEINSEITTVTVYKFAAPKISVKYDDGERFAYENEEEGVTLTCYYADGATERTCYIDGLNAGTTYTVYGRLTAESYKGYTYLLDSDNGATISVQKYDKPKAPARSDDDTLSVDDDESKKYTFYYRKGDSGEYTVLPSPNNSVGGLDAGNYTVCAVKNGKFDGGVYYVHSERSDATSITKANILFDVTYNEGSGATITFREGSDEMDFSVIVTYWGGDGKHTLPEAQMKWKELNKRRFRVLSGKEGVTGISVTIKMNGVSATNFWGTTK